MSEPPAFVTRSCSAAAAEAAEPQWRGVAGDRLTSSLPPPHDPAALRLTPPRRRRTTHHFLLSPRLKFAAAAAASGQVGCTCARVRTESIVDCGLGSKLKDEIM